MIKKCIISVIILIAMFLDISVMGQDLYESINDNYLEKYNIVNEYSFLSEPIIRNDAIAALAKLIGVPKDRPEWVPFVTDSPNIMEPPREVEPVIPTIPGVISIEEYAAFLGKSVDKVRRELEIYEDYDREVGKNSLYYIECLHPQILYGDEDGFIYPNREITLKEAVALIMRCLEENCQNQDLEYTFSRAKEINLISANDKFFTEEGTATLDIDDYCILLYRMLNKKRYVYVEASEEEKVFKWFKDEEHSITYLEFLEQKL